MSTRVPFVISKTAPNTRVQGIYQGKGHPSEVINHHAPLTPRSTQPTGLFKRASEGTVIFFQRVFRGEGATENFRVILN